MYNHEIKEIFLNEYPDNTRHNYARIFQKSAILESKYNKDLYSFKLDELKEVLYTLDPLTINASEVYGRIITVYISWAIENKYINDHLNPLKTVNPQWFDQFVDKTKKLYITEKELQFGIEDRCNNYQDKVIFRLLFEGIQGIGASELINLKREDVDFGKNILTLHDDRRGIRRMRVSDRAITFIERALEEKSYLKKNGETDLPVNVTPHLELVDNDYVIKNTITQTDRFNEVDKHTIYRRIAMIKELFGYPYLTLKNIVKSGQIHLGKQLFERYGELGKMQYIEISEHFNLSKYKNGNKYEYTWHILKKHVNLETIKEMYINQS